MTQYKSKFTGPEIDAGIEKANASDTQSNDWMLDKALDYTLD